MGTKFENFKKELFKGVRSFFSSVGSFFSVAGRVIAKNYKYIFLFLLILGIICGVIYLWFWDYVEDNMSLWWNIAFIILFIIIYISAILILYSTYKKDNEESNDTSIYKYFIFGLIVIAIIFIFQNYLIYNVYRKNN